MQTLSIFKIKQCCEKSNDTTYNVQISIAFNPYVNVAFWNNKNDQCSDFTVQENSHFNSYNSIFQPEN